jgi:hypothetical protein
MKILAFSHLTFTLPREATSFGNDIFGNSTEIEVQNHANKKIFMGSESATHYLYWNKIGIEITSYHNTKFNFPESHRLAYEFLANYANVPYQIKICYSPEFISFLKEFGRLKKIRNKEFLLKGVGVFNDLKILHDCTGPFSRPNQYLDEAGLSAIALYVDSVAESIQFGNTFVELKSKPYEVCLGSRKFQVQFVKIGGVNIELLSRG